MEFQDVAKLVDQINPFQNIEHHPPLSQALIGMQRLPTQT